MCVYSNDRQNISIVSRSMTNIVHLPEHYSRHNCYNNYIQIDGISGRFVRIHWLDLPLFHSSPKDHLKYVQFSPKSFSPTTATTTYQLQQRTHQTKVQSTKVRNISSKYEITKTVFFFSRLLKSYCNFPVAFAINKYHLIQIFIVKKTSVIS